MRRVPKAWSPAIAAAALALLAGTVQAGTVVDLLEGGAARWSRIDDGWQFGDRGISGRTSIMDGAKTDPAASTYLVSRQVFEGDITVRVTVTFDEGRYLGVYVDFDQDSQTGIWMATGHPLADDAPANEVERVYIKTVEESFWIVRATGALDIEPGQRVELRFTRAGDVYNVWHRDTLLATYRKPGGYAGGPLMLRLVNASATIHRLEVEAGVVR